MDSPKLYSLRLLVEKHTDLDRIVERENLRAPVEDQKVLSGVLCPEFVEMILVPQAISPSFSPPGHLFVAERNEWCG